MLKTLHPDHQTINLVVNIQLVLCAVTCTVCMHIILLKMLCWVFGTLISIFPLQPLTRILCIERYVRSMKSGY